MVVIVYCTQALLHDTIALQFREAVDDETCRLTTRVHLAGTDGKVLGQAHRDARTGMVVAGEAGGGEWAQCASVITELILGSENVWHRSEEGTQ